MLKIAAAEQGFSAVTSLNRNPGKTWAWLRDDGSVLWASGEGGSVTLMRIEADNYKITMGYQGYVTTRFPPDAPFRRELKQTSANFDATGEDVSGEMAMRLIRHP